MSISVVRLIIGLFCLPMLVQGAYCATSQNVGATALSLNRTLIQQNMNKQVTVEGFYYDGSIPMLVKDMELIRLDKPIPPDKYVPLMSALASSVKQGAKVKITGLVQKPTGGQLAGETVAVKVVGTPLITQQPPSIAGVSGTVAAIQSMGVLAPPNYKRYAILIGGGKNPPNSHARYWNDLHVTYDMLIAKGYQPGNIAVAYENGHPRVAGQMPVNYMSTVQGIQSAFTYVAARVKPEDTVFIMIVGQSAPYGAVSSTTTAYWTWQTGVMTPLALAAQVNRLGSCKTMVHITPSYSGAFANLMIRPNRIIVAASAAMKDSYAHPSGQFGNFNYWYLSGLRGTQPIGGTVVDADANNDHRVSLAEAYNYTLTRPNITYQTPQFEGNGRFPTHYGTVTSTGPEGPLGLNTYP